MKDEELFIEEIRSAASNYACDTDDNDYDVLVRIKCEDGWTSAEIIKK